MKWRASQIGKLMTTSRSKTDVLSQTAKSYIEQLAKEDFFGYTSPLVNRYLDKGINQELESINLLNSVRFENYEKNDQRIENEFITGECDILTNDSIIDIKTSWSLDTLELARQILPLKDSIIAKQKETIATQGTQVTELEGALLSKDNALRMAMMRGDSLQAVINLIPPFDESAGVVVFSVLISVLST